MCLYSAASMLLRRASAACQSLASRPLVALSSGLPVRAARVVAPAALGPRGLTLHPQPLAALTDGTMREAMASGYCAEAMERVRVCTQSPTTLRRFWFGGRC
jgi:hypothetical protein